MVACVLPSPDFDLKSSVFESGGHGTLVETTVGFVRLSWLTMAGDFLYNNPNLLVVVAGISAIASGSMRRRW